MKQITVIGILLTLLSILSQSCIKETIDDLNQVTYHPSYSVPIGPMEYSISDLIEIPGQNVPIPINQGNATIIEYNNVYFPSPPMGYDTLYIVPARFSELSPKADDLESIMIRNIVENGIPLALRLQIYLYKDGIQTGSLYPNGPQYIEPAEIHESDTNKTVQQIDTHLRDFQINYLKETTHLGISISILVPDTPGETIHLNNNQTLNFQLALRAALSIPL